MVNSCVVRIVAQKNTNINRKNGVNKYGDVWANYGIILIKWWFQCLNWIFLLHAKLIKSRFHGIRHRKLNISWIIDVLGSGSPYFCILLDQNTSIKSRKNQETSLEKMGKLFLWKSETQEFQNFRNLRCPFLIFGIQNSWIFDNWKW